MNTTKLVALFIILFAIFALWLNSQGKLIPIMQVITENPDTPDAGTIGQFVLAFILYIIVISFLSPRNGFYLTGILVMGALLINGKNKGADGVIPVLFGGTPIGKQP